MATAVVAPLLFKRRADAGEKRRHVGRLARNEAPNLKPIHVNDSLIDKGINSREL